MSGDCNPPPEAGHEPDLGTALGVFIIVFWPVSVVLALIDVLFFRGHASFPIVFIIAAVTGLAAVWRYLESRGGAQRSA